MKFIKLTHFVTGRTVRVNVDHLRTYELSRNGECTWIEIGAITEDSYVSIKETPDDIDVMIAEAGGVVYG